MYILQIVDPSYLNFYLMLTSWIKIWSIFFYAAYCFNNFLPISSCLDYLHFNFLFLLIIAVFLCLAWMETDIVILSVKAGVVYCVRTVTFCVDVCRKIGKYVTVCGKTCINVASLNFLGMSGRSDIEVRYICQLMKHSNNLGNVECQQWTSELHCMFVVAVVYDILQWHTGPSSVECETQQLDWVYTLNRVPSN